MNPDLFRLIEASLEFHYYRSGNQHTALRDGFHSYPHMVIGQIRGGDIISTLHDGTKISVADEHGYCFPRDETRSGKTKNGCIATFHWAHINYVIFNGVDLQRLIPIPYVHDKEAGKKIGRINRRLTQINEQKQLRIQDIVERKQLGFALLGILLHNHDHVKPEQLERLQLAQRMQPALAAMQEHMRNPISMKSLAQQFGLSQSRFHELFVQCTGIAPGQYQLQLRLHEAQMQLISSGTAIKEIAAACGFDDNHYFSRIFKKHVGLSPAAYRKQGSLSQVI